MYKESGKWHDTENDVYVNGSHLFEAVNAIRARQKSGMVTGNYHIVITVKESEKEHQEGLTVLLPILNRKEATTSSKH